MTRRSNEDRRDASERRAGGDRRRGGEGRHVVLHLGRSHLHLGLVVRDPRGVPDLLHTTSIEWRKDSAPLPSISAVEALTAALKELVSRERVAGCPATLVLNGELCVTRVTSGPTAHVDRVLEEFDERSQLYLSLGAGKKALATSRSNLDARHEQAVVSVSCESTISSLIQAFEASGLDLRFIEAETVALARAHGSLHPDDEEPVLLVQFDGDGFEIVVAHGGAVLLDYRPGGATGAGVSEVLNQHHARLQRFCQRQLSDFGLKLRKVYLAGQIDQVRQAAAILDGVPEYDTQILDTEGARSHWQRAPEKIEIDHAVLIGRALREIDVASDGPAPNLMERWIAESRKHIRPILLRAFAPIAATLLVAVGLAVANFRVASSTNRLDLELANLSAASVEHSGLRLKLIASQDKLHRLERLSQGAPSPDLTGAVEAVGGCLPEDVWLKRLTLSDLSLARLTGASYSERGVYDFVSYLNQAPVIQQVALEGTSLGQTRQGPATNFDVNFMLAPGPRPGDGAVQ